ncbi:MAG: hypothetical protein GX629_03605 [Phycisphaerae bacterium]|nr:hypothetical protein [Phycisphaerae bacterium]
MRAMLDAVRSCVKNIPGGPVHDFSLSGPEAEVFECGYKPCPTKPESLQIFRPISMAKTLLW